MRGTFSAADYTPGLLCATKIFFQKKIFNFVSNHSYFSKKNKIFNFVFKSVFFSNKSFFQKQKKNIFQTKKFYFD